MYAPARHRPKTSLHVDGVLGRGALPGCGAVPALTLALALWLPTRAALAHDTWFAPLPATRADATVLAPGTGNRFPVQEFTMTMAQLQQSGCRIADEAATAFEHAGDTPTALRLRTPWPTQATTTSVGAGTSCWAQSVRFDIELPAEKVALYLKEINASATVRAAWSDMQSRGLPWKERYTKHARIELDPSGTTDSAVLRDGQPLADFAVELQGDRSPPGLWQRTDAEGRVRFKLPLAGRWVLRGTDLRLSTTVPNTWESRFVTLAFEVAAKDAAVAVRTATP